MAGVECLSRPEWFGEVCSVRVSYVAEEDPVVFYRALISHSSGYDVDRRTGEGLTVKGGTADERPVCPEFSKQNSGCSYGRVHGLVLGFRWSRDPASSPNFGEPAQSITKPGLSRESSH